jgi:hypothetical protein
MRKLTLSFGDIWAERVELTVKWSGRAPALPAGEAGNGA